jgi:hypothetical protein
VRGSAGITDLKSVKVLYFLVGTSINGVHYRLFIARVKERTITLYDGIYAQWETESHEEHLDTLEFERLESIINVALCSADAYTYTKIEKPKWRNNECVPISTMPVLYDLYGLADYAWLGEVADTYQCTGGGDGDWYSYWRCRILFEYVSGDYHMLNGSFEGQTENTEFSRGGAGWIPRWVRRRAVAEIIAHRRIAPKSFQLELEVEDVSGLRSWQPFGDLWSDQASGLQGGSIKHLLTYTYKQQRLNPIGRTNPPPPAHTSKGKIKDYVLAWLK